MCVITHVSITGVTTHISLIMVEHHKTLNKTTPLCGIEVNKDPLGYPISFGFYETLELVLRVPIKLCEYIKITSHRMGS